MAESSKSSACRVRSLESVETSRAVPRTSTARAALVEQADAAERGEPIAIAGRVPRDALEQADSVELPPKRRRSEVVPPKPADSSSPESVSGELAVGGAGATTVSTREPGAVDRRVAREQSGSAQVDPPLSNLTRLTTGHATVPRHRVFDDKLLDPQVLLLVLHEWVPQDEDDEDDEDGNDNYEEDYLIAEEVIPYSDDDFFEDESSDEEYGPPDDSENFSSCTPSDSLADRTAVLLSLVDSRFYTSLYHSYHVRREVRLSAIVEPWARRCMSTKDWVHRLFFAPHFDRVVGNATEWMRAARHDVPCYSADEDTQKRMIFARGFCRISTPLDVNVLDFRSAMCSSSDRLCIVQSLENLSELTVLDISWCKFNGSEAHNLIAQLIHLPKLRVLDLSANKVGATGARALASKLRRIPLLTKLNLTNAKIYGQAACVLIKALHRTPRLATLSLSGNKIGEQGCASLAAVLPRLPRLCSLDMYRCKIQYGEHWAALARALHRIPRLTMFDLRRNRIEAPTYLTPAYGDALVKVLVRLYPKLAVTLAEMSRNGILADQVATAQKRLEYEQRPRQRT